MRKIIFENRTCQESILTIIQCYRSYLIYEKHGEIAVKDSSQMKPKKMTLGKREVQFEIFIGMISAISSCMNRNDLAVL